MQSKSRLNLSRQSDLFPLSDLNRPPDLSPLSDDTTRPRFAGSHPSQLTYAIIGCGGIGSNLANLIARLGGEHFILFDPDEVAEENIAPGWFRLEDVGRMKVDAVALRLEELGVQNAFLDPRDYPYKNQLVEANVVIVATDKMDSRRRVWRNRDRFEGWRLWIDCRMGGDQASVYVSLNPAHTVDWPEQDKIYMGFLSSYDASLQLPDTPLPCGMKATAALTVGMIPGMVGLVLHRTANFKLPPKHMFFKMDEAWWTVVEA